MIDGTAGTEHQGQIVAQYRKMNKWSREKLAEALHVDVSTAYRMERHSVIKNLKRRELLVGLLGIPATLMGLDSDSQHFTKKFTLNDDHMAFFEHEMAVRWEIYYTGGTIRAYHGLDMWFNFFEPFTQESHGSIWHKRSHFLLSMSYQLQGSIFRDMLNYQAAYRSYKVAYQIAEELLDSELMAATLARRGVTSIQENKPERAIQYLNGALNLINGRGLPLVRGNVLQALSEAYAMTQQYQKCWRSIGLAERILEHKEQKEERTRIRFNGSSIIAQKGVDALLLHDYRRAIALIDKSLITYDPTLIRGRARLNAQKAEAYYGLGLLDICTATAEEALALANSVGASKTITRLKNLYVTLIHSSWRKETSVARLGALLSLQECKDSG